MTTVDEAAEATKGKYWDKEEHRDHHGVPRNKGAFEKSFRRQPHVPVMGMTQAAWSALTVDAKNKMVQIDHVTPRAAGGCPRSTNNTQAHGRKCANCARLDEHLGSWSSVELEKRRLSGV